ncbi:MAG: class I SAM-dependent methyltransferase [Aeromicrobium sp.]
MPEEARHGYTLELSEPERMRYRMMAGLARENEADLWACAGIVQGSRVADVGCGPGAVLTEIAQIVGPEGTVVGVEPGEPARAAAREELDSLGLDHVEVREGNGETTGLDPGAWDCVMMRHVLTHTGDGAERIVAHLATLLAPGGHLYLVDTDLDAARATPPDPDIREQFDRYAEFHRALGNDVRMGPRLGTLLRAAGLEVAEHRGGFQRIPALLLAAGGPIVSARDAMIAHGILSQDETESWETARQRYAAQPDAELWMANFIAIGRKPEAMGWPVTPRRTRPAPTFGCGARTAGSRPASWT